MTLRELKKLNRATPRETLWVKVSGGSWKRVGRCSRRMGGIILSVLSDVDPLVCFSYRAPGQPDPK